MYEELGRFIKESGLHVNLAELLQPSASVVRKNLEEVIWDMIVSNCRSVIRNVSSEQFLTNELKLLTFYGTALQQLRSLNTPEVDASVLVKDFELWLEHVDKDVGEDNAEAYLLEYISVCDLPPIPVCREFLQKYFPRVVVERIIKQIVG